MKKLIVVLMVLGLFCAIPVLAAEHENMDMSSHEGMTMDTPDGARECALQAETIQAKIQRLNAEVAKGSKKYNANELKKLEKKLQEANEILDQLTRN
jgi:hypothetical protein